MELAVVSADDPLLRGVVAELAQHQDCNAVWRVSEGKLYAYVYDAHSGWCRILLSQVLSWLSSDYDPERMRESFLFHRHTVLRVVDLLCDTHSHALEVPPQLIERLRRSGVCAFDFAPNLHSMRRDPRTWNQPIVPAARPTLQKEERKAQQVYANLSPQELRVLRITQC